MATRSSNRQSGHDAAVYAAASIYRDNGKFCWINPGSEKNQSWSGYYIDVIAAENQNSDSAWVIEIETEDSVSDSEAKNQWVNYAKNYSNWCLAVPVKSKDDASALLSKNNIDNCTIITWRLNDDGTYTFWGLPGL